MRSGTAGLSWLYAPKRIIKKLSENPKPRAFTFFTGHQSRQQGVNGIVSGYPGVQLQFQVQAHLGFGHIQRRTQNIVCRHL